jgi:hypothetical protein
MEMMKNIYNCKINYVKQTDINMFKYLPFNIPIKMAFYNYNNVTDEDINTLTNLKYLDLSYCYNITDKGLQKLNNLEHLNIRYTDFITNKSFENKSKLIDLNISSSKYITDDILEYVVNLEKLDISFSNFVLNKNNYNKMNNIKYFNLYETGNLIDNNFIEKFGKIEYLNIKGCIIECDEHFLDNTKIIF